MTRRSPGRVVAVLAAALVVPVGALAGCSSGGGDAGPLPTVGTLPDSTGDACTDPMGVSPSASRSTSLESL